MIAKLWANQIILGKKSFSEVPAQLKNKVAEHNNFARRMPVIEEQIKVANHRIEDLERKIEHE